MHINQAYNQADGTPKGCWMYLPLPHGRGPV